MPAPGIVLAVAVVLIVAALVYYLVSTIVALRRIAADLDQQDIRIGLDHGIEALLAAPNAQPVLNGEWNTRS